MFVFPGATGKERRIAEAGKDNLGKVWRCFRKGKLGSHPRRIRWEEPIWWGAGWPHTMTCD